MDQRREEAIRNSPCGGRKNNEKTTTKRKHVEMPHVHAGSGREMALQHSKNDREGRWRGAEGLRRPLAPPLVSPLRVLLTSYLATALHR
jgi:hypothetical protein